MFRLLYRFSLWFLLCAATYAQGTPGPAAPHLLRVAVLPFENRTPNPNVDWISNLFVESYKTELRRRFRYDDVSEEAATKALEFIAEYKISGKVRYQIFSAMTGADIVMGGSFSPSGSEAIVIESQLYYAKTNRLEVLDRQPTPIDSAKLFPAVDKSAAAAAALLGKGKAGGGEKPDLFLPHAPRLLFYSELKGTESEGGLTLNERLHSILGDAETRDFHYKALTASLPASADEEAKLAAELMRQDHAAYAIIARKAQGGGKFTANVQLYSPLKPAALANFSAEGGTEQAALAAVAQQVAVFIRTWKFNAKINIEGLKGKDLVIEYAGLKKRETSANGELNFDSEIVLGGAYEFKLVENPVKPSQRCFVVNGSGRATITGINHATAVCITKRYVVAGTVEGLTGGDVVVKLGDADAITLSTNAAFRFPDTLEDFEPLRLQVMQLPMKPPQQCDFVSPPARVSGKAVSLRLYCMPKLQHWLTVSGGYPIMHGNSSRAENLRPDASFPLDALSGRFGVTAGYWAKYYLRYNILVGGEATYAYYQGKVDLYTSRGIFVEADHSLLYHSVGLNALMGYPFRLPGKFLENTRLVGFGGLGGRYVSLRSSAPINLLSTFGPGAIAGINWYYELGERFQAGIRYHADMVYISGEPVILQHIVGLQLGVRL